MEEEEMDSLFDGMVLFNPSQPASDSPPKDHQPPPLSPSPPPQRQTRQSTPPPPPLASSASTPLDENLFSDLTLITPINETQSLDSQPVLSTVTKSTVELPSSTSISRQVSRKKKKAGIRIGYGRDTTSLPEEPITSSFTSTYSVPIVESERKEKASFEDKDAEIPSPMSTIESEVGEIGKFDDTNIDIPASKPTIEVEDPEDNIFEDVQVEDGVISESLEYVGTSGDSIEEKLVIIKGQISEKIEGIQVMAATVSARRKQLARERRKAAESVNSASLKYKELEKELEEACEAEDFEKAESLSESLASADKEKEGLIKALRDAEVDCDSVELKMQEVLELQIAAEQEGVLLLEQFAKDAADNAHLVLRNAEELSSKETAEWSSSAEAVEVKKFELEIESDLINDARMGLNDKIEHVIEDDRREQEILYKKRDLLKQELEKLLALVKQKETEIVENESNIQVIEGKIAGAVSGFHDVQSSIDTKYYDMQSVISTMDSEKESLSKKKLEIDDFLSQEEKRGQKLQELANVSMDEAKACQELVALRKSLALPILKYREVKLSLGKTEAKVLEDVHVLKHEVSTSRASLQELSSARSNIQQEVTSTKQRIFFIDKRTPELESEKRVAAAARNFKEAGRIATEIKTLSAEKETIQTKMESDISQLNNIEQEINTTIENLNEKEELILVKEKEAARLGCERLRLVSAAVMAERSAAMELGDDEEAMTLLAEAEAADMEAEELQKGYDLKEEEFGNTAKGLISIELVAKLGRKQLAEMAAALSLSLV